MIRVSERGFSLVELSIVLVIVGTLAGSAVIPLGSAIRQSHYRQTERQLQSIRMAMHGYLASNGKLPCPVGLNPNNKLGSSESGPCTHSSGGVPAIELGIMGERSTNGELLDRWGRSIRYAVSLADNKSSGTPGYPDWLTTGEAGAVGAENLNADLALCREATNTKCAQRDLIANQIVWVIYSLGEHDGRNGIQIENQDNDNVFAVSAYSSHADQPFDDQIIWASRSELVYWLLKANWLP